MRWSLAGASVGETVQAGRAETAGAAFALFQALDGNPERLPDRRDDKLRDPVPRVMVKGSSP